MTIDAEGRFMGRWNLFDVVVALFVVALVPLGYGAYALFRTPTPRLTAVEPAQLAIGRNARVTIKGENLRPYLRVSFGNNQGRTFQFVDSSEAVVELNDMPPGTYDVVLYDYGQERSRIPGAFTVLATAASVPQTHALVFGRFINLKQDDVVRVLKGMAVPAGEVLELGTPRPSTPRVFSAGVPIELPASDLKDVPALVRASCVIRTTDGFPECMGASHALRPNYIESIPLADRQPLSFQIDDVRGEQPIVTLTASVRFSGPAVAVTKLRAGDLDLTMLQNPLALGAKVIDAQPAQGAGAILQRDTTVAIRAQRTSAGWQFLGGPIREGGGLVLRTPDYEVSGTVISLAEPAAR